jgi:acyl-CoA thioester hydrolase
MSELQIRVSYADTDQMGMVYYANYLQFFERGRTEWLREKGLRYKDLEDQGVYLPVIEASCRYLAPARYDELVLVRTEACEIGFASVEFGYDLFVEGKKIATGRTKHPFVNRDFKPARIPEWIKEKLK